MRPTFAPLLALMSLLAAAPALGAPDPGSVHRWQRETFGKDLGESPVVSPLPAPLPPPTPGPDKVVYGYLAYWDDDLNQVPWDELSHIAIFSANATTSGGLTETSHWDQTEDAVAIAQDYGVKVHLTVTNFDPDELAILLGSSSARAALIDKLVDWKADTGADGINIDFEGMPKSQKANMVQFTKDLEAEVGEVVLATPAVDWSGAWDYSELTKYADLFIMGYGYHWSGSDNAGPNDPLFGGSPWGNYALDWTIDDYASSGADMDRVILGLPLYGIRWPVSSTTLPAPATGNGTSIFWTGANNDADTYGVKWDNVTETPYYNDNQGRQAWYSNVESVQLRTQHALDEGLGGIGFWALNYDDHDDDLWTMIHDETTNAAPDPDPEPDPDTEPEPTDTGGEGEGEEGGPWKADAGRPFLAYVGDTVFLSGKGSSGPEGADLQYAWKQLSGPIFDLDDKAAAEPSFRVDQPGTAVFALAVGDGTTWSPETRSYVIVVDPEAGDRHRGGCDHTGHLGGMGLGLLALAAARRRRAR